MLQSTSLCSSVSQSRRWSGEQNTLSGVRITASSRATNNSNSRQSRTVLSAVRFGIFARYPPNEEALLQSGHRNAILRAGRRPLCLQQRALGADRSDRHTLRRRPRLPRRNDAGRATHRGRAPPGCRRRADLVEPHRCGPASTRAGRESDTDLPHAPANRCKSRPGARTVVMRGAERSGAAARLTSIRQNCFCASPAVMRSNEYETSVHAPARASRTTDGSSATHRCPLSLRPRAR